ncbi:MAG: flagellar export chaperone FliS [Gammaproteobacteria bacterium]|jgi:flagellar protein FliS|nr:flagellar export chaperone FliS [Gammaproteobacteria bacterium]MDP6190148.1 flagellar export chaperone FliS [Gammaproteobacteria bacterium]
MIGYPSLKAKQALQQYGQLQQLQASEANPHKMISMLFAGAVEALNNMSGAMANGRSDVKGQAASKAIAIINGMRDCLDLQQGQELAQNLYGLYSYLSTLVFQANYENDISKVCEVRDLLQSVQASWDCMPQANSE